MATGIVNKGFGAGGVNTNVNGLSYEKLTDLCSHFIIIEILKFGERIRFNNSEKEFVRTKKANLFKYMAFLLSPIKPMSIPLAVNL